ncbi:MAG: protein phosphatase CheZ [Fibrobacterota bacterium]
MNLGQELKDLVRNISVLMDSIITIRAHVENSMGNLPMASGKLEKVTGETETATQQLMDVLDKLSANDKSAADLLARMGLTQGTDGEAGEIIRKLSELLDKNQVHHIRMLEILQFQDLTSQQINYVGSLLEKIECELNSILGVFGEPGSVQAAAPNKAFDENASYLCSPQAQSEVDSFIHSLKKDKS